MSKKLRDALRVAADALSIAADWNVDEVQLDNVPSELGLKTVLQEDEADELDTEAEEEDNMYSTRGLAQALRRIADEEESL